MSIVIDDPDLERDLRRLAAERGESVEDVLRRALGSAPATGRGSGSAEARPQRDARLAEAQRIVDRIHARIVHDRRSPDEIIGYDDHGLPQ